MQRSRRIHGSLALVEPDLYGVGLRECTVYPRPGGQFVSADRAGVVKPQGDFAFGVHTGEVGRIDGGPPHLCRHWEAT